MIVRTKNFSSDEEKSEAAKKSLEYAKKAVSLDLKDSESWCKEEKKKKNFIKLLYSKTLNIIRCLRKRIFLPSFLRNWAI